MGARIEAIRRKAGALVQAYLTASISKEGRDYAPAVLC